MAITYLRALLAEGYDTLLMLPEDGHLADKVRDSEDRERAFFLPPAWRLRTVVDPFFRARMKKLLHGTDLIIVHNALLEACMRRLAPCPIASVNHLGKIKRMGRCDAVITLASAMQRLMSEKGGPFQDHPRRALLVANGLAELPPAPKYKERNPPTIGFLGSLLECKGCFDLLEALESIKSPRLRVLLAGEGSAQETLEARTARLPHDVVFQGHVDDLSKFFSDCDIFCLPSHNEAFGLSLVEAMAHGIPAVAAETDGPSDIIQDGENGLLVPPQNPPVLAAQLRKLISAPALRRTLGENARCTVEKHYAPKVFAQRLSQAVKTLVALGHKPETCNEP